MKKNLMKLSSSRGNGYTRHKVISIFLIISIISVKGLTVFSNNNLASMRSTINLIESRVEYNGDWEDTLRLSKQNGKYINFWVNNTGETSIIISIDSKNKRVLQPKEQGHITIESSYFTKDYLFEVSDEKTTSNNINFDFKIAQRAVGQS